TGIKTNIVYAKKGLAERLQAEGRNTPADVILTVDIARLYVYSDKNLLAKIKSKKLQKNIPSHLRSEDNSWFGLSKRVRVIAVSNERIDNNLIKRYEDLSNPILKNKICSRPGSHVYNRALMSSMIEAIGLNKAEEWAIGMVSNFARRPQSNDRAQLRGIYQGECDLAIVNHYYYGKLKYSNIKEQRKWMENISLVFPNQGKDDRGVHVNISGGGVVKYSKNKNDAIKFLEFLSDEYAQKLYGDINYEYPVNLNVMFSDKLKSWGQFKEDSLPIQRIAIRSSEAQKIIDKVGW
ncbi:extracellular solute-binding protein, partial [Alphaproteobacteria bacterium]|nr:extracellular solute-binding protein [Alphaproteobacteria bacterium]